VSGCSGVVAPDDALTTRSSSPERLRRQLAAGQPAGCVQTSAAGFEAGWAKRLRHMG
jgi:hypothetical protein